MSKFFKSLLLLLSAGLFTATGWAAETWTPMQLPGAVNSPASKDGFAAQMGSGASGSSGSASYAVGVLSNYLTASAGSVTVGYKNNRPTDDNGENSDAIGEEGYWSGDSISLWGRSGVGGMSAVVVVPTASVVSGSNIKQLRVTATVKNLTVSVDNATGALSTTTIGTCSVGIGLARYSDGAYSYINTSSADGNGTFTATITFDEAVTWSAEGENPDKIILALTAPAADWNNIYVIGDVAVSYLTEDAFESNHSTRTLSGEENLWNDAANWSNATVPSEGSTVELLVSGAARLTMDANASIGELTINDAADGENALTIATDGTNKLTADTTTINTDTTVEAGAAFLDEVTVAGGKTLTVNDAYGDIVSAVTNNGVLAFAGTESAPLQYASDDGTVTSWAKYVATHAGTYTFCGHVNVEGYSEGSDNAKKGWLRFQANPQTINIVDGANITATRLLASDGSGAATTINQEGGTITLTSNVVEGSNNDDTTGNAILLGHWPATTTYNLKAGSLLAEDGALNLGWDGPAYLTIGQDSGSSALVSVKRLSGTTRSRNASITINPTGTLRIGDRGIQLANTKSFTLAGGTLQMAANMTADAEPIALSHAEGLKFTQSSTIDVAANATIPYSGTITGGSNTLTKTGDGDLDLVNASGLDTLNYVVNGGTLILPAGTENGASVTRGTLKLLLSPEQLIDGYTADVADGTVVTFVKAGAEDYETVEENVTQYELPAKDGEELSVTVGSEDGQVTAWSGVAKAGYVYKNTTLSIHFTADNQTFTFDNTLPVYLTSLTVTAEDNVTGATIALDQTCAGIEYDALTLNTTVSADAAFYAANVGTISGTGKLCLASGELTLDEANTYTGGTDIAADATLTITNKNALGTQGNITGAGTLECKGNNTTNDDFNSNQFPANKNGLGMREGWSGTVRFKDLENLKSFTPSLYGNEGSKIELYNVGSEDGEQFYFSGSGAYSAEYDLELIISGKNYLRNGNESSKNCFKKVTGTGELVVANKPTNGHALIFEDTSGFEGNLTISHEKHRILLGDNDANLLSNGQIVIAGTAVINQDKTFEATNGVTVTSTGTLSGTGTIDCALSFDDNATIDTTAGAVKVTGAVTLPSALTVKIAAAPAVGTAVPLLNASNVTIPEGMDVTVMVNGVEDTTNTYRLVGTPTALLLDNVPAKDVTVAASTEALTESFTTLSDASGRGIQVDLDAATPYAPGWVCGQSYALKSLFLKKRSNSADPADAETTVSVVDVDNTSVVIATSTSCETTNEGYLFTFANAQILDASKTYQFRTSKKVGIRGVSVIENQSASLYLDENLAIVIPAYVPLYTLTAERIVDKSPILSGDDETLEVDTVPEKIRLNTATFSGYGQTFTVLRYTGDDTPDWDDMYVEGLPAGVTKDDIVIDEENKTWGFKNHTLTVLPVGDSITAGLVRYYGDTGAGWHVAGGYRLPLYQFLTQAGYGVNYMGTSLYSTSWTGDSATSNSCEDRDIDSKILKDAGLLHHEGHSGTTVDQLYARFKKAEVQTILAGQGTPDVITLHLGTNDFGGGNSVDTVKTEMKQLLYVLNGATAEGYTSEDTPLYPNAKVLVAKIIPRSDKDLASDLDKFNTWLASYATACPEKLVLVDLGMDTSYQLLRHDRLHPSTEGYMQMARGWFAAIEKTIAPRKAAATIASVDARVADTLTVTTNKAIDTSLTQTWTLNNGATVSADKIKIADDKRTVTLTVKGVAANTGYTLTATNLFAAEDSVTKTFTTTADIHTPKTDVTETTAPDTSNSRGVLKAAEWTTFEGFVSGFTSPIGYMPESGRAWKLESTTATAVDGDGVLSLNGTPLTVNFEDGHIGHTSAPYTVVMTVSNLSKGDVLLTESMAQYTNNGSVEGTPGGTNVADAIQLKVKDTDTNTLVWGTTEIPVGVDLTDDKPDTIALSGKWVNGNNYSIAVNGGEKKALLVSGASQTIRGSWSIGALSRADTGSSMKLYRLSFYEGEATVVMPETTATINVGEGDNLYTRWSVAKEALGLEDAMTSVTINFTEEGQIFTFDEAVTIDAVTVQGEAGTIAKDGDATVTVTTTTVDANVTINAGVATLDAVTINAEKTLTIKENLTDASFVTSLTNNGTLRFEGGTDEVPLEYAYAKVSTSKVKIAANSVVKCNVPGNRQHTVEGENAKTSIWRPTCGDGYGFNANTTLTCLTLDPRCGNASQGIWFESGRIAADNVILHVAESNIAYLRCDMTFSGLSGAGKVNAAAAQTLTLDVPAGTEVAFSGSLGQGKADVPSGNSPSGTGVVALNVVVTGEGAQTLAGTHYSTGTLTVSENTALNLGSAWASGAVAVTGELALTNDVTIGGLSGAGTISIPSDKALTYASTTESTFSGTIEGAGGLTVSSGTLALTGANTYNGATTIEQGAKVIANSGASSTWDYVSNTDSVREPDVTVNGELEIQSSGELYRGFAGTGKITTSSNVTIGMTGDSGHVSGLTNFKGELIVKTGTTLTLKGWSLQHNIELSSLQANGNVTATHAGAYPSTTQMTVHKLAGPGTIAGVNTFTLATGATIDVSAATAVTVNATTISLPDALAVTLPDAAEMPVTLLNTTAFAGNVGEVEGVTLTVDGEQTGDYILNKTAIALTLAAAPWEAVKEVTAEGNVDSWSELLAAMAADRKNFDAATGTLTINFGDKPQDGEAVPGTFTFDGGDVTLASITVQGTNGGTIVAPNGTTVTASTSAAINTAVAVTGQIQLNGATIAADAELAITNYAVLGTQVSGAGALKITGATLSNYLDAKIVSDSWTGTVVLADIDDPSLDLAKVVNADSSLTIEGDVKAYIYNCKMKQLTLNGAFYGNNGTTDSTQKQRAVIGSLTGDGTVYGHCVESAAACAYVDLVFTSAAGFTGTIDLSGATSAGTTVCFGEAASSPGQIVFTTGADAIVPTGKTWTAVNGIYVHAGGTIRGNGTLAIPEGKAFRYASSNTSIFGGTITGVDANKNEEIEAEEYGNLVMELANVGGHLTLSGDAHFATVDLNRSAGTGEEGLTLECAMKVYKHLTYSNNFYLISTARSFGKVVVKSGATVVQPNTNAGGFKCAFDFEAGAIIDATAVPFMTDLRFASAGTFKLPDEGAVIVKVLNLNNQIFIKVSGTVESDHTGSLDERFTIKFVQDNEELDDTLDDRDGYVVEGRAYGDVSYGIQSMSVRQTSSLSEAALQEIAGIVYQAAYKAGANLKDVTSVTYPEYADCFTKFSLTSTGNSVTLYATFGIVNVTILPRIVNDETVQQVAIAVKVTDGGYGREENASPAYLRDGTVIHFSTDGKPRDAQEKVWAVAEALSDGELKAAGLANGEGIYWYWAGDLPAIQEGTTSTTLHYDVKAVK